MFLHNNKLMYTVRIGAADPRCGDMLLEQFGGANGELAAAMQYVVQGINCDDPYRKDLLMDIGTEELSHLEVVGTLARMHLRPAKSSREAAEADPLLTIAGGGCVNLINSMGTAWTANYLMVTGELDVDLINNIAAEARVKIVYERQISFSDDQGIIDALQFLMNRKITHMKAFSAALESMKSLHSQSVPCQRRQGLRTNILMIQPAPETEESLTAEVFGIGDQNGSTLNHPYSVILRVKKRDTGSPLRMNLQRQQCKQLNLQ
jgi:Mn-containing catalase